ncbi:hypothetical protein TrCOL_g4436 [Triparma columacea]|uniref:tRNA-specific adenosine deaminase 1 n=1 Tax=Triparma columacea TaxID=722753 RepID=A0A9W7G7P0_9STRA|nr:hypothetical protein TrCOL_g4436 [Triparma columacea]
METYSSLPNRGKALPSTGEWCVLSSIVCEETCEKTCEETCEEGRKLWVVSIATGSKCVGPKLINQEPRGYVLHDCHAEVLAKRGFTRVLLEEMKSGVGRLLVHPTSTTSTTPELKFHLYVSESPCGDAAIYNIDKDSTPTFTGAKICSNTSANPNPTPVREPESQALATLRLKSGRSNIPTPHRSLSHCCSDKILRWSILGLGGSLVQSISPPPVLSSVVVVGDPRCTSPSSIASQQASLTRAITERGGCEAHVIPQSSLSPTWELSRMSKQEKFKKISPSGMSINFVYTDYKAGKGGASHTEIVVGATGVRQEQGKKKKRKIEKQPTDSAAAAILPASTPDTPPVPPFSRLCRRELLGLALEVSLPQPTTPRPPTYQDAKTFLVKRSSYSQTKSSAMENNLKNWVKTSDENNFKLF